MNANENDPGALDAEGERLLSQVVTGELSADSAPVRALVGADKHFARELAELTAISARLDRAAESERGELSDATGLEDAPGRDRVHSALERARRDAPHELDRRPGPRSSPRFLLLSGAGLAAAAALMMLAWYLGDSLRDRAGAGSAAGGASPLILGNLLEVTAVQGAGPIESLQWTPDLVTGGWYEVRVFSSDDAAGTPARVEAKFLEEARWTPTASEREALAGLTQLRVEVDSVRPGGAGSYKSGELSLELGDG